MLEPTGSVPREVRRVATERLTDAISVLDDLAGDDSGDIERGVHSVRKRCKEVRAVARLVRESIGDEFDRCNRTVREAADTLAPIRDAHALLSTFDDLRAARDHDHHPDLETVRAGQAEIAAEATRKIADGGHRIGHARALLVAARDRIERWDIDDGFAALAAGIDDTYRRGRTARRHARKDPTDDHLHEWRKAVKNLWYQVRLIEPAGPSALAPLVATLDDLAEALGDDHDLAVLIERLASEPDRFGGKHIVKRTRRLARRQQDELRRRAFRLGATVYAEKPAAFTRRMEAYWNRTLRDGPELTAGGIAELADDERRAAATGESTGTTVERERKFLVTELPELPAGGIPLRQGYLALDGTVSVRVRDAGDEGCTLTVKAGRGSVRMELEFGIDSDQFAAAWDQTRGRRVHKTRHRLPLDGHIVELDIFHEDLHGLVMAEVEFDSDESMAAFEAPAWFGREVTDDSTYSNASLAVNAPHGRPTDANA